jgi:para-nitrobenzyl esterase
MVWIHGGAFFGGGADDLHGLYDGQKLADEGRVVVVTIQYRLGALGFLAHPALSRESSTNSSGNYGILDCILALKWINKNIEKFGGLLKHYYISDQIGDAHSITVFGESAGAMITAMLSVSPLAKGLFSRAIMQSPADLLIPHQEAGYKQGLEYSDAAGCKGTDEEVLSCMRSMPTMDAAENLLNYKRTYKILLLLTMYIAIRLLMLHTKQHVAWAPTSDGYVFERHPRDAILEGAFNDISVMIGFNSHEGSLFILSSFLIWRDISVSFYESIVKASFPKFANEVLKAYPPNKYPQTKDTLIDVITDSYFMQFVRVSEDIGR